MVSSTVPDDGDVVPKIEISPALGAPTGDYRLVGWDMDTTGKHLIDEICQIAGYTPGSKYSQYVLPFRNLSPAAKKRHCIKVVSRGRYRALKSMVTNDVVPTKSVVWALIDFLDWLEKVKGDAADGVILVHHEPRKVIPSMLIESLTKYNLLEKFRNIVKGFVNGFNVAETNCAESLKAYSLRILSRVLLEQKDDLSNAGDRARLALQVVQHLSVIDENGKLTEVVGSGDGDAAAKITVEFIRKFVQPVSVEEEEHAALKVTLAIQNSLKPIFHPLLSMIRRERQQVTRLRRLLAEAGIDYAQTQEAWDNGKRDGLEKLVKSRITAECKDLDDLVDILDTHFDPEKCSPVPEEDEKKKFRKPKQQKKRIRKSPVKKNEIADEKETVIKMEDKVDAENNTVMETPDTTTADLPVEAESKDVPVSTTTDNLPDIGKLVISQ